MTNIDRKVFENARFCPKGDIEANWKKAINFIPLKREIIEYLPDENYAYTRFKVGDGVTKVNDLPFSGGGGGSGGKDVVQPDYTQNDSTADDYIKNRPFYSELEYVKVINGSYDLTEEVLSGVFAFIATDVDITPLIGKPLGIEYLVTLNGTQYKFSLKLFDDHTFYLGNPYLFDISLEDTGEPVLILFNLNEGVMGIASSQPGMHTLLIEEIAEKVTSIEEKFLPQNMAFLSDISESIEATFQINEENTIIQLQNLEGFSKIDWGDGTINAYLVHNYKEIGTYKCKIYGVDTICSGAFWNCSSLTSVVIGDSVTSIGNRAFGSCDNLTSVVIGDSVTSTSIGDYVFSSCIGLTSVVIGNGVTSIGAWAFMDCSGLTSVIIPDSVTSIGVNAFYGCSGLTSVYITDISAWCSISFANGGANPLSYSKNLYLNNKLVTELVIPGSVTSIGNYAFSGCSSLTEVVIPDSVTSIGRAAFSNCNNITEITLPFVGANKDETSNSHFGYIFGANDHNSNNSCVPTSLKKVTITTATSIGELAFFGCRSLTSVVIGDSVTSIGTGAFEYCRSLTSITIPDSVTSIGDWVFSYCESLTSIEIPDSVTSIGSYEFEECYSLKEIILGSRVKEIPGDTEGIFYNCPGLTTIVFKNTSPINYEQYMFDGCTSLTHIYVPYGTSENYKTQWASQGMSQDILAKIVESDRDAMMSDLNSIEDKIAELEGRVTTVTFDISKENSLINFINGLPGMTKVDWGDGTVNNSFSHTYAAVGIYQCKIYDLTTVCFNTNGPPDGWMPGYEYIVAVDIGKSVTSVQGLYYMKNIVSLIIPDSVTSIGKSAFYSCGSLTSIEIPDSVTGIGDSAFSYCSSLTSVVIGDSVTSIGSAAFKSCSSLTSITIPDSVTSIGASAFQGCSSLTNITIPDSVTSIGSQAFSGCSSLTEMTIPFVGASKDNIYAHFGYIFGANDSYHNNDYVPASLKKVVVTGGNIGSNAFRKCETLTSVVISDSVTSIGDYAFYMCIRLTSIEIPDSVTSIGERAFAECSSLTSVEIPYDVTSIGIYAFSNCISLTSIDTPTISRGAFYGCSSLKNAILGEKASRAMIGAFANCTELTTVEFKNPSPAFYESELFSGCTALINIYVPYGTSEAYKTEWAADGATQDILNLIVESDRDATMSDVDNLELELKDHVQQYVETNISSLIEEYLASNLASYDEIISDS